MHKQKAKRGNSTLNTVSPKTEKNFNGNPNQIIFGHFCIFGLVKVTLGCWLLGQTSFEATRCASWKDDKLTSWQTHRLTNCISARLTRWQDDKLKLLQIDRMTGWQDGRLPYNKTPWWLPRWYTLYMVWCHDNSWQHLPGNLTNVAKSWQNWQRMAKFQKLPKVTNCC